MAAGGGGRPRGTPSVATPRPRSRSYLVRARVGRLVEVDDAILQVLLERPLERRVARRDGRVVPRPHGELVVVLEEQRPRRRVERGRRRARLDHVLAIFAAGAHRGRPSTGPALAPAAALSDPPRPRRRARRFPLNEALKRRADARRLGGRRARYGPRERADSAGLAGLGGCGGRGGAGCGARGARGRRRPPTEGGLGPARPRVAAARGEAAGGAPAADGIHSTNTLTKPK